MIVTTSDQKTEDRNIPKISVVVATFNRRDSLKRMVESLRDQTLPADQFEVVIVSDGSTDGTVEMLEGFKNQLPGLQVLPLENRGPGAARNSGAAVARGKYLAFTDDDCVAAPDWLEQLLNAFQRTQAVAVQGRTTTDRKTRTPLTHQIEITSPQLTSLPTCNAAYLRSVFLQAGGFDHAFKFAHNEDADLAWRVEDLGPIVFAPEAHIVHPPRRDRLWKRAGWVRGLESEFLLFYKNRKKYRDYVSPSPWWTIYWKVFIIGQISMAMLYHKYLIKPFRPTHYVLGLTLVLARWYNLVRFFPAYWKAQAFYRSRAISR